MTEKRKVAVLFTEHNLDAVFAYASRVVVLVRGSIIAQGAPQVIAKDSLVQAAYTGGYVMPSAL
jgi:branched-chain amino acid transport system ATP-binding protein